MCKIDQKIKCADTPLQEYQVRFNKSCREKLQPWTFVGFEIRLLF